VSGYLSAEEAEQLVEKMRRNSRPRRKARFSLILSVSLLGTFALYYGVLAYRGPQHPRLTADARRVADGWVASHAARLRSDGLSVGKGTATDCTSAWLEATYSTDHLPGDAAPIACAAYRTGASSRRLWVVVEGEAPGSDAGWSVVSTELEPTAAQTT